MPFCAAFDPSSCELERCRSPGSHCPEVPRVELGLSPTFRAPWSRFYEVLFQICTTQGTHRNKAHQCSFIYIVCGCLCIKTTLALQGQAQEWLLTLYWRKNPWPTPISSQENSDFCANCLHISERFTADACSLKIIPHHENRPFLAIWVLLR